MQSSTATYIPRLDHLRFIAVLLVFGWHALHLVNNVSYGVAPRFFVLSIFEEGHTGVSLFLVLSGFVFASLCHGREVLYWPFMRNRALRVGPLLILWMILTYHLMRPPADHLFAILLGFQNQEFPGPGWTVLVEFQLYLVFPFLLRFTDRYGVKYLIGVLLVAIGLRAIAWVVTRNIQFVSYWTVFGRVDQFVLGMLGYRAYRRYGKVLGNPLVLIVVLFFWLVFYHWFNRLGGYYVSGQRPGGSSLWIYLPTLEGVVYGILTASYLSLPFGGIPLLGRLFAWLGSLSYSIYLCHYIIAQAAFSAASSFGVRFDSVLQVVLFCYGIILPIAIGFSALTYYVVELPFLRMRRPYLVEAHPARPLPNLRPGRGDEKNVISPSASA